MEIAQRLKEISRIKAELDAEAEILELLPRELNVSSLFRISGNWHLNVKGQLPRLLELLPPVNARMSMVDGSWQAYPEDKPLDWNQRALALRSDKNGVEWHYKMSFGPILSVKAESARLPVPEGYEVAPGVHNAVAVRKLQPLAAFVATPEESWQTVWEDFFKKEQYGARQRMFACAIRVASSRDQEITMEMLPIPAGGDTMQIGDATLEVLRSANDTGPAETTPEGSPFYLARIGHFWRAFSKDQAQRLVDFCNAQRCDLKKRQEAYVQEGIAKAKEAIAKFQAEYMGSIANYPEASVLTRYVQEQSGYPVSVAIRSNLRGHVNREISLWLHLCKWNIDASLTHPEVYSPTGFDFHDPVFYQYQPNSQSLFPAVAVAE